MKNFCIDLREHATKIINYKKNNLKYRHIVELTLPPHIINKP